jgi:hypothetical protein
MNTDKKVFNKLFSKEKVELESHKIELALVDEIKSADKFLTASFGEVERGKNVVLDAFKMYKSSITRSLDTSFVVFKLTSDLMENLKSTGIAMPSEYVAIRNNAQNRQKELQNLLNTVNKAMGQI